MRVLEFSQFDYGKGGGAGTVPHELSKVLADLGVEVALFLPGDDYEVEKVSKNFKHIRFKSHNEGNASINPLSIIDVQKIFKFLNDFSPDVVHIHDIAPVSTVIQLWAIRNNVPCIHTAHVLLDRVGEFGLGDIAPQLFIETTKVYYRDFYKNCSCITAITDESVGHIRSVGYKGDIEVIPNGRYLDMYKKCEVADIDSKEKYLCFIGYITDRKNQKYLLDVLTYLPKNYKIFIIGTYLSGDYREWLEAKVEELGLSERVIFTGQIPHKKVPDYLEKTHVFTSASTLETLGLIYIESLASGTPVVSLRNYGTDILVSDEVGKNLELETSPKVFAKEVDKISRLSQKDYEKLAKRCRKSVKRYDWEVVANQFIELYKKYKGKDVENLMNRNSVNLNRYIKNVFGDSEISGYLKKSLDRLTKTPKLRKNKKPKIPKKTLLFAVLGAVLSTVVWFFLKITRNGRDKKKDKD